MCRLLLASLRVILCGFIVLGVATTASAQFKAGVQGSVTDATGAVISGATVTLTNNETDRTQRVTASHEGFYRISGLPPGRYTLSAEHPGFKKKMLENITISAESAQGIDITLDPGEVVETVTVTAEGGEQLKTENPNIDRAITNREVLRLPQTGRDPYELIRLTPGVFGDGARAERALG